MATTTKPPAPGTPVPPGPAPNMQDVYTAMAQMNQLLNAQRPTPMSAPGGADVGSAGLAHALLGGPMPVAPQAMPGGLGQYLLPAPR